MHRSDFLLAFVIGCSLKQMLANVDELNLPNLSALKDAAFSSKQICKASKLLRRCGESNFSTLSKIIDGQPQQGTFPRVDVLSFAQSELKLIGASNTSLTTVLSGHVRLLETSDGLMSNLKLIREHADLREAREQSLPCLEVLGGPWKVEESNVRSQGGAATLCTGNAANVHFERCTIGGTGTGFQRAGEGLSAKGRTRARVVRCDFNQCLAAVIAAEDANVCIDASSFAQVSYALCLDGRGHMAVSGCRASEIALGLLVAGGDAATLELSSTAAAAPRLWFGGGRPRVSRFENNTFNMSAPRTSPLQESSAERTRAARARAREAALAERPLLACEYPGR